VFRFALAAVTAGWLLLTPPVVLALRRRSSIPRYLATLALGLLAVAPMRMAARASWRTRPAS
jgi:hypothetical protein